MQSPLLGFNNNVKHRGRLFHIQTEDSGIRHPHVITHLFADGGRILKTIKTSYAQHVGNDRLSDVVRELMKEQHKTMFIALRDGAFDHVFGDDPQPGSARNGDGAAGSARSNLGAGPGVAATRAPSAGVAKAQQPPAARAAVGRREAPDPFGGPPPGAAVDVAVAAPVQDSPPLAADDRGSSQMRKSDPDGRGKTPSSGRYVASRPAAIFSTRPAENGGSIFGDDLISEKSLDEVILSYLSEDLENSTSKK
jgi:hypothetical protein